MYMYFLSFMLWCMHMYFFFLLYPIDIAFIVGHVYDLFLVTLLFFYPFAYKTVFKANKSNKSNQTEYAATPI